jgi:hypothetical protein
MTDHCLSQFTWRLLRCSGFGPDRYGLFHVTKRQSSCSCKRTIRSLNCNSLRALLGAKSKISTATDRQESRWRGDIAPTHSWLRHWMGWVVSVTPRPRFTPGKGPGYPLDRRLGGLVRAGRLKEKYFAVTGDRTPVVQCVVTHYTDWATPAAVTARTTEKLHYTVDGITEQSMSDYSGLNLHCCFPHTHCTEAFDKAKLSYLKLLPLPDLPAYKISCSHFD